MNVDPNYISDFAFLMMIIGIFVVGIIVDGRIGRKKR